jgi:hypothetical protein
MLNFVESLAQTARIFTVSCRTDLISFYTHRGYKEVKRVPVEEYIPAHYMTRSGLKMVIMTKEAKSKLTYEKIRNSSKVTSV